MTPQSSVIRSSRDPKLARSALTLARLSVHFALDTDAGTVDVAVASRES
jgi:hypothetical protein